MIVHCPHCSKQLKLSEKVRNSIVKLEAGQKIKVKCVHCSVPFGLDATHLDDVQPSTKLSPLIDQSGPSGRQIRPPAPPDIEWLKEGDFEDQEIVEEIPRALVLISDPTAQQAVVKAASDFGYLIEQAASSEEAVEKMRFVSYAAVFLHSRFESAGLTAGKFHQYMRAMDMSRRRYIFYVLIGDQFETLYDLQALAYSANLVVNDNEVVHIGTLLKKAIPEYEKLFGPLMDEIRVAGK